MGIKAFAVSVRRDGYTQLANDLDGKLEGYEQKENQ